MTETSNDPPAIVWFRWDLRLADHEALAAAERSGRGLLLCYIGPDERPLGAASRWWLHHSLASLGRSIAALGGRLILRRGPSADVLAELVKETGAAEVHCSAALDADGQAEQQAARERLDELGVRFECHPGVTLLEPAAIRPGNPYRVFTPFWKSCRQLLSPEPPLPAPRRLRFSSKLPRADRLEQWALLPLRPNWAAGFEAHWQPGEQGAAEQLGLFLDTGLASYAAGRDVPARRASSRLSPHLRFGEISPRQVYHAVTSSDLQQGTGPAETFLRQLGWREFNYHLLAHWPDLSVRAMRPEFDAFPWRDDAVALRAWQRGETGYPLVDAGMRELWATGWMHNRVRMVAASLLIKHLLIPWQQGEAWFWDTLVDADPANNAGGWQWVAGSGADAAPYFRIFNPTTQGKKFDPSGAYVARWVPELAALAPKYIHEPSRAPAAILEHAGVVLGETYPWPLVEHGFARARALDAYALARSAKRAAPLQESE